MWGLKLSQHDVLRFLRENKKRWFTANEISKEIKVNYNSTRQNLKKLRHSRDINFRITKQNQYLYNGEIED